jgi:hypothetical protein
MLRTLPNHGIRPAFAQLVKAGITACAMWSKLSPERARLYERWQRCQREFAGHGSTPADAVHQSRKNTVESVILAREKKCRIAHDEVEKLSNRDVVRRAHIFCVAQVSTWTKETAAPRWPQKNPLTIRGQNASTSAPRVPRAATGAPQHCADATWGAGASTSAHYEGTRTTLVTADLRHSERCGERLGADPR